MTQNIRNHQEHFPDSVESLAQLIRESGVLQRFGIHHLGVFGSFARHEQANDIDLLIEDDISLEDAMAFKKELSSLVDYRLDIMLKRFANPIVLYRAQKDMYYVER